MRGKTLHTNVMIHNFMVILVTIIKDKITCKLYILKPRAL